MTPKFKVQAYIKGDTNDDTFYKVESDWTDFKTAHDTAAKINQLLEGAKN